MDASWIGLAAMLVPRGCARFRKEMPLDSGPCERVVGARQQARARTPWVCAWSACGAAPSAREKAHDPASQPRAARCLATGTPIALQASNHGGRRVCADARARKGVAQ